MIKLHWDAIFFAFIELAILVNLVILDIAFFTQSKSVSNTPSVVATSESSDSCGPACQLQIRVGIMKELASQTPTPTPTPTPSRPIVTIVTPTTPKEYYVPFGSGATQNDQWEDISGVTSYIDSQSYGNIQTVYFEVSMGIPTKNGIVSCRLYDVTDKHPVWNSELSTDSDVSKLVTGVIKLDPGNKQYQVQMKTSLKYNSILDLARVKIITK